LDYERKKEKINATEFDVVRKFDELQKISNSQNKISSYLTIQEGCDKFCHFCVVPYTRGPEYSRPFKQIIDEAKNLVGNGAREIVLLGQNVNAYNYNKKYRLSSLIRTLNDVKNLKRIRFTTSHPKDMTEDLIDCYRDCKKLMPFLHLPIQSGSNKILKLMNRKHNREYYMSVVEKLKKVNKNIKISSDFIVGYPGETEKDFEDTIELVKKIGFINSYSFIFSPRPGTPASKLQKINSDITKNRLKIIQNQLFNLQLNKNKELEGKKIVLETGKIARQADGAVIATCGETVVISTVVGAKKVNPETDYFPLQVNYQEKYYAAGKIPGGYFKREARPTESETLISRLIDRPIRPLFPEDFRNEVQILPTVLSYDHENEADILSIIASSAALAISGLPFQGPIAASRVGYINNNYVLNPSKEELKESKLDLVVAGTKDAVLMVESEASSLTEKQMLDAVKFGHEKFIPVIKAIESLAKKSSKEAWKIEEKDYSKLKNKISKELTKDLEKAFQKKTKRKDQN